MLNLYKSRYINRLELITWNEDGEDTDIETAPEEDEDEIEGVHAESADQHQAPAQYSQKALDPPAKRFDSSDSNIATLNTDNIPEDISIQSDENMKASTESAEDLAEAFKGASMQSAGKLEEASIQSAKDVAEAFGRHDIKSDMNEGFIVYISLALEFHC